MTSYFIEGDVQIVSHEQIKTVNEIINNFEYYVNKCFKSEIIYVKNEKIKTKYENLGMLINWDICSYKKNSKRQNVPRKYKLYFLDNYNKRKICIFPSEKLLLVDCSIINNNSSNNSTSILSTKIKRKTKGGKRKYKITRKCKI
jgi:hypothetical protein